MPKKYVFDVDAHGKSEIVIEQDITTIGEIAPSLTALDLWRNSETPADLGHRGDPTDGSPFIHEPPDGGAVVRIIDFRRRPDRSIDEVIAMHAAIGSVHVPDEQIVRTAKHSSMHRTDTLNYFCLVSGRLWAISEGREVLLEPGDVVIQKGCMHSWKNDQDEVARLFCVLVDAKPSPPPA